MKILFLYGKNQYNVVSTFINEMIEDICLLGHSVDLIDAFNGDACRYSNLALSEYGAVISFTGIGLRDPIDGSMLIDKVREKANIPVFVYLVDHPIYQMKRFFDLKVIVLCVDEDHCVFAELCGLQASYFPHATASYLIKEASPKKVSLKKEQILFPISYFNEQEHRDKLEGVWAQLGPAIEASTNITEFMQRIGLLPYNDQPVKVSLNQNVLSICTIVDKYLRGKDRRDLLLECHEQNISLTVIGKDSDQYKIDAPSHTFLPAADFSEIRKKIAASKFVLHQQPGFKKALHERVIESAVQGTLVVTKDSSDIKGLKQLLIEIDDMQTISDKEYEQRVLAAQKEVEIQFTWLAQWKSLLQNHSV